MKNTFVHPLTSVLKRTIDLVGASLGLLLTLLLLPFIALAIKLESPGPVLFKQLRIGRSWPDRVELFGMLKFRSMRQDAERGSGPVWAQRNDPRITRVGRFLRKTRLDELPQFINVLRGEMSLIGPRPERPGITRRLEHEIPFFVERTYGVAPGITGLAQVCNGYDESIDDVRAKLNYDLAYSLCLSRPLSWLQMETRIVCLTLQVMICGRGR
ncbi:sugar transferase [Pseudomonas sp.]|jgi:lipopolysaccharide/colanic/teichoic acid biosynthesis glycosyltransferase|uniref:sugar transferase n=1 Tax=Pseudomonas sp. TaxID=306 RepID=UPI0037C8463A